MVFHIHFKLHIRDQEHRGNSCFQNSDIYPPNWTASYPSGM